jgi:hypothetical protein
MNWLKKRIQVWALKQEIKEKEKEMSTAQIGVAIRAHEGPDIDGLRFTIMKANGGVILQSRTYDRRKDENNTSTYIIGEDEPYAERIGQIVSMEILKL